MTKFKINSNNIFYLKASQEMIFILVSQYPTVKNYSLKQKLALIIIIFNNEYNFVLY